MVGDDGPAPSIFVVYTITPIGAWPRRRAAPLARAVTALQVVAFRAAAARSERRLRGPLGGARERGDLADEVERQAKLSVCPRACTLCLSCTLGRSFPSAPA